jgi:undecaprenyl-phosphate 4-deoxy-4-formamido-L-arabinose transferase
MMRHLLGVKHARDVTAFKVFRTALRDAFAEYRNPYVSIDLLLTWGTDRFGALTVRHDERPVGRSQFTLRKTGAACDHMITGFSVVPLRVASLLGFAFALMGFVVLMYVLGEFLVKGSPVKGFLFWRRSFRFFSGAQLLALGIIGEYLARGAHALAGAGALRGETGDVDSVGGVAKGGRG